MRRFGKLATQPNCLGYSPRGYTRTGVIFSPAVRQLHPDSTYISPMRGYFARFRGLRGNWLSEMLYCVEVSR